jgi:hypothetical protein
MLGYQPPRGARLREAPDLVKADLAALTPAGPSVSIRARMWSPRTAGERHPPMMVEVDHAIVVSLRPVARQRDVNVARLVRDLLDAVGEEPSLVAAILDDEKSSA